MTSLFLQSHWRIFGTSVGTLLKGRYCLFPDFFWHTFLNGLAGVFVYSLFVLSTFPHFYRQNVARCCSWGKLSFHSVLKANSVFSTSLPSKPAHWIWAPLRSFTSWPSPYTTKVKVGVLWTAIRSREKPDWTHYTAIKHFVPINTSWQNTNFLSFLSREFR